MGRTLQAALLLVLISAVSGRSLTYDCPNSYNYPQFNPVNDGLKINTMTSLAFQTAGGNDAHILLQHNINEFYSNVIEIVLGG
ncbi:hypothetical protein DPMN_159265, partial [Dreissena polymorpha]